MSDCNCDFDYRDCEEFDCIVVGIGGHGSSILAQLAKSGQRVLGIEQFPPVHAQGSSHGKSRIYRQSYFEDPKYVPLLQRALVLWNELEDFYQLHVRHCNTDISNIGSSNHSSSSTESSSSSDGNFTAASEYTKPDHLLSLCGGVFIGAPNCEIIRGSAASARQYSLPHQLLSPAQLQQRFPLLRAAADEVALLEENAGFLHPEACVEAYIRWATLRGAQLHFGETMISWSELPAADDNGHDHDHGGDCNNSNSSGGRSNTSSNNNSNNSSNVNDASSNSNSNSNRRLLVRTDRASYVTRRLVLAVGAWAPQLYGAVLPQRCQLRLQRRVLFWFRPDDDNTLKQLAELPIYFFDLGDRGSVYGFPEQSEVPGLVKVAFHSSGSNNSNDSSSSGESNSSSNDACNRSSSNRGSGSNSGGGEQYFDTPAAIDRSVSSQEVAQMRAVLAEKLPAAAGALHSAVTCMYTTTPDGHFIIDKHPQNEHVILVSPCSGHGFKFCSVVGEIVCDLVIRGSTAHDIALFSLSAARTASSSV